MTQDNHKFEVIEAFKKNWPILVAALVFTWAVSIIVCWSDNRNPQWLIFMVPAILTLIFLKFYIYDRKIVYEISGNKIVKKRSNKILRSVEFYDIQGFKAKLPVRLKVPGQKDFVFEQIVIKSSHEKLISVLREIGLNEVPSPPKYSPLQITILIGAIICTLHFSISILHWLFGPILLFVFSWIEIDWLMFLHSIPAFALFGTSALALTLIIKRRRKAGLVLLLTVVLSMSCSVFEIGNHYYNGFEKNEYFTWWLYRLYETKKQETPAVNYRYKYGYKYGYINKSGETVINPQFDTTGKFSEGMAKIGFRYEIDDPNEMSKNLLPGMSSFFGDTLNFRYKYGFINSKGDILVEPVYDDASEFSEGLACVAIGDMYGYIDQKGEIAIEPKFENAWSFHQGRAKIEIEDHYGYIDKTGKIIIEPQFPRAENFSEGLAVVKIEDKYGYIDKAGQVVIKPEFDNAKHFSEGFAAIRIGEKYGYIDKTGQVIIKPQFDNVRNFSEGLAVIEVRKWKFIWKWGYINKSGQMVVEPQYYQALQIREGLGNVCSAQGWGYRYNYKWQCIGTDGKVITKPYFDKVRVFNEGLARVWVDDKYGYIDKNGTMIIEPQFDEADNFFEGLASIGVRVEDD